MEQLRVMEFDVADLTGVSDRVIVGDGRQNAAHLVTAGGTEAKRLENGGSERLARPEPASLASGPPLEVLPADPATVTEAILASASLFPSLGMRAVGRQGDSFASYPELCDAGRRVLGGLRLRGVAAGAPVILLVPELPDYFPAVWGCLLGGNPFATVAAPPRYDETGPVLDKLMHAWRGLGQPPIVCDSQTAARLAGLGALYKEQQPEVLSVGELLCAAPFPETYPAAPEDVALLALSSGSTGRSKIIQVTHRAVVQNALSARQVDLIRAGETSFNWLPFDHVAPVVMYLLRDVVLGCSGVHAPTSYIVERPTRWLDVLERYGVHHTWSANFAYRMLGDALVGTDRVWDLSRLRTMLNAGEQCSPPVIRAVLRELARSGVGPEAIIHMWGMAETATGTTSSFYNRAGSVRRILRASMSGRMEMAPATAPDAECLEIMSMGPAMPGACVRVTDEAGKVLPEGRIGRFQVQSPRVTPGYLGNPAANAQAFTPDGWFDTGDLACMLDGEVLITGRSKELIVVNGEKYLCQEIEETVASVPGVEPGLVAACGVPDPVSGSEVLAVFYVTKSGASGTVPDQIKAAVSGRIGFAPARVVPVDEAVFPRTTSGKIQRTALVDRLLAGEFDAPEAVFQPVWRPVEPQPCEYVPPAGPTLLFTDGMGLGAALTSLSLTGEIIKIRRGVGFWSTDDGYTIDPDRDEDWRALKDELERRRIDPVVIVYLWSYLPAPDAFTDVSSALRQCGAHLVAAYTAFPSTIRLITASRRLHPPAGDADVCFPAAQTPAITAAAVAEQPDMTGCHVDLPGGTPAEDAAVLVQALGDRSMLRGEVVWRDSRPHLKEFADAGDNPGVPLVRGGRYLVTGGSGGVGTAVLADLIARYDAELLVVSRSRPSVDTVRWVKSDVRDAVAVRIAVEEAEAAWCAPLDGVLHLADSFWIRPLRQEEPSDWDPESDAKVGGLLTILPLLRERPGARLVVFSSLMSTLPFVGCSAYAARNALMDAVVEYENARGGVPSHSIAWALWQNLGRNADNPYEASVNRRGVRSLPAAEALSLHRWLAGQAPGVYYAGLDADVPEIRERVAGAAELPPETAVPAGPVTGAALELTPEQETAFTVVSGAVDTVTARPAGLGDSLHELGLGSVQLLQLHARLEELLDRELDRSLLFDAVNVRDLVIRLA
jgi:acyl-CoA synthetase (AMP-forming)/AMP-acid ligase II/NAD(P)-dependent dehydrogenase (short-subunit alcohol dehydrogenase family)